MLSFLLPVLNSIMFSELSEPRTFFFWSRVTSRECDAVVRRCVSACARVVVFFGIFANVNILLRHVSESIRLEGAAGGRLLCSLSSSPKEDRVRLVSLLSQHHSLVVYFSR